MSLISDVTELGQKLASGFLNLDDLAAGQGVAGEGTSQLARIGRWGAGTVLVSSNLAARTFQLGVQAGARTAKVAAEAAEGVVPGAEAVRRLAEKADARAVAAAEEASRLASYGAQLTAGSGKAPENPLTKDPWLGQRTPPGYTWAELTADTVVGPYGRIAALPLSLGLDAARAAAATGAGRMTIKSAMKAANGLLDLVSRTSGELDREELRDALLAVANSTGTALGRDLFAIAEAAVRFTLGDPRRVHRGMTEGLEELRRLAAHRDMDELLPALPVSATLRDRAQRVVDNPPARFLAAIAERPPRVSKVFKALIEDADPLRAFLVNYPQVFTLLGVNTGLLLAAGLFDVGEIEEFVRDDAKAKPWSALELEDYVGQAVLNGDDERSGYYPEPALRVARAAAFLYSSEVLGREKALERTERLFGEAARERLERDVSLELDVLRAAEGEAREERVRERIDAASEAELVRLRDTGQEQLDSLEAFAAAPFQYVPDLVRQRIDVLRYFLSLTNQELALRGAEPSDRDREQAQRAFAKWSEEPVPRSVLSFDGVDDYIDLGIQDAHKIHRDLTLECWVNTAPQRKWSGIVCNVFDTGDVESGFGMMLDEGHAYLFGLKPDTMGIQYHSSGADTLRANQWQHVAMTYDGRRMVVYVDGEETSTAAVEASAIGHDPENSLSIGRYKDDNEAYYFRGQIAEVRLWSIARSQKEIRTDKDRSLSGKEPGLIGYWPMNEGKGDRVDDKSSHGHAGTIHGATWSTSETLGLLGETRTAEPVVLEGPLWLDASRKAGVAGSVVLKKGKPYRVVMQGTFSPWGNISSPGRHSGEPEDAPMWPTPGKKNNQVGMDPEFLFAWPSTSSANKTADPPPRRVSLIRISVDGGAQWVQADSSDPYDAAEHRYAYDVIGAGHPLQVKLVDSNYRDNYGRVKILVETPPAIAGDA